MARIIRGPGVNSMSDDWAAAWLHMTAIIKTANISVFIGKLLDDFRRFSDPVQADLVHV
jgi:hypothetical protein